MGTNCCIIMVPLLLLALVKAIQNMSNSLTNNRELQVGVSFKIKEIS